MNPMFLTFIFLCVKEEAADDIHDVPLNFQFTIKFSFSCLGFSCLFFRLVLLLELYSLSSIVLGSF